MNVEPPLESGAGHWTWYGGRPALDLLNTRRERWRRDIETLVVAGDLGGWLAEARLAPPGTETNEAELAAARRLRDAIDAGVDGLLDGRPVPTAAVDEIDSWLDAARLNPRLELRSGCPALVKPPPANPVAHGLGVVALDAARMLGTEECERLPLDHPGHGDGGPDRRGHALPGAAHDRASAARRLRAQRRGDRDRALRRRGGHDADAARLGEPVGPARRAGGHLRWIAGRGSRPFRGGAQQRLRRPVPLPLRGRALRRERERGQRSGDDGMVRAARARAGAWHPARHPCRSAWRSPA